MVSPLEVLGQLKFQWQWIASQAVAFLLLYLLMRKFAFAAYPANFAGTRRAGAQSH